MSVVVSGVLYRFKLVLPSLLFLFPINRVTTCDDFMNKLFAFSRNVSLGRLWFYPHCSHWLFQASSVCATAHVKSHAAIHQVEEDNGIYGTALKVTHPTPTPLQLTTRPLFLIYLLMVSQDFQFPVLPSFLGF